MNYFKIFLSVLFFTSHVSFAQTVGKQAEFNSIRGTDYVSNLIINPSAFKNANNVTVTNATAVRDDGGVVGGTIDGVASWAITTTALNGFVEFGMLGENQEQSEGNCVYKGKVRGNSSLHRARLLSSGGAVLAQTEVLGNNSNWKDFKIIYACGGARKVRITQTEAGSAVGFNAGKLFYGSADNELGLASADYSRRSYTPTFTGFGTVTNIECGESRDGQYNVIDCKFTTGTPTAVEARVSLPSGNVAAGTSVIPSIRAAGRGNFTTSTGATWTFSPLMEPSVSYLTFGAQGSASGELTKVTGSGLFGTGVTYAFSARVPIAGWDTSPITSVSSPSGPTIQKFTSGSGTYTTPAGVKYIRVKMVGGGGGGQGSGTSVPPNAGAGNASTFGTSLLTANGGGGAGANGASGGSGTINSPAIGFLIDGGKGQGIQQTTTSGNFPMGGMGGSSVFGGAGGGGFSAGAGAAGVANAGGGGGGAGAPSAGSAGGGGGAGGYVEATISAPAASYSYAVGAGGTAGSPGTSGFSGGAGGSGHIIVEEYYSTSDVISLAGNVVYNTAVQAEKFAGNNSVDYGTFSATLTGGTNAASVTSPVVCNYTRVGNTVSVGCNTTYGCTTAGGTVTLLTITPPISTTQGSTIHGTIGTPIRNETGRVENTGNTPQIRLLCENTAAFQRPINYTYQVP